MSANGPNQVLLETISRCPAGNPMQMPPAAVQCGQLKAWGGFVRAVITGWDAPPTPSLPSSPFFLGERCVYLVRLSQLPNPAGVRAGGLTGRGGGKGSGDKSGGVGTGPGGGAAIWPGSPFIPALLPPLPPAQAPGGPSAPDGSRRHRPGQAGRSAGSPSPGFRPILLPATTLA